MTMISDLELWRTVAAVRADVPTDAALVQRSWPVGKPLLDGFGGGLYEVRKRQNGLGSGLRGAGWNGSSAFEPSLHLRPGLGLDEFPAHGLHVPARPLPRQMGLAQPHNRVEVSQIVSLFR